MPLSAATANVLRVLICFQPDNNGWFASFPIDSMLCCRFKNMLHKPLETFCEDKFDIFKQWSFAPMLQGTETAPCLLESGWALISIFQGRHPIKGFIILRPEVFFSWQKSLIGKCASFSAKPFECNDIRTWLESFENAVIPCFTTNLHY